MKKLLACALSVVFLGLFSLAANAFPIADPSFEDPLPGGPDRFGKVFMAWGGWVWSQPGKMQASPIAHSGKLSAEVICGVGGTARYMEPAERTVPAGRYRLTVYVRGLDVQPRGGIGVTIHFYDDKWLSTVPQLVGTFGWRKLTYVAEVAKEVKSRIYLGLDTSGRVWFDDVSVEEVGADVALTPKPVVGPEEAPIAAPGELVAGRWVYCPDCGYRNIPEWKNCYACGAALQAAVAAGQPLPTKLICGFEQTEPGLSAAPSQYVEAHATEGRRALRWDVTQDNLTLTRDMEWSGYDYLKADYFLEGDDPVNLYVEIRDAKSNDYWTRVNYETVLLPGQNTLVLPIAGIYVGEKSRPGRALMLNAIKFLAFGREDKRALVYLDNLRLESDRSGNPLFDGLHVFRLGTAAAQLWPGMARVTDTTLYTKGRGYGLKDAEVWRSMDVLQPDPIYRDFICILKGGLTVDLPNGRYTVFVNDDCPGGFWGEEPVYRKRSISAQGKVVFEETMDRQKAIRKYYRFADSDDRPSEDTFDKYLGTIFQEKTFEAEVTDGQLFVAFEGPEWCHCVSLIVIYPSDKKEQGERYLAAVHARRKAEFNLSFQRLLHQEKNAMPPVAAEDQARGYVVFSPSLMEDVYYDTVPRAGEITRTVHGAGCAGQIGSLNFAVRALKDVGVVTVTPGDLRGPGTIPASAIKAGYISNRITRVSGDGTIYTISPRYVMNRPDTRINKDTSIAFLANVRVPPGAARGLYRGQFDLALESGQHAALDVEFEVLSSKPLDEADLPVGPWGLEIGPPWFADEIRDWNRDMDERSMALMREYGMNYFATGLDISTTGRGDAMTLGFARADELMAMARKHGMKMIQNYGAFVEGLNVYGVPNPQDPQAFGFDDLRSLYAHIFKLINAHAAEAQWLPLAVCLCDEPDGEGASQAAANAALLREFATPRVTFTGASSLTGAELDQKPPDPHVALCKALAIADLNLHDARSVAELLKAGGHWAFYNGNDRWTYGVYMFMLRHKWAMRFRTGWHWNACAGDPYYGLDCREDDACWANSNARGELVTSLQFERLREGVDDYRYLLTLQRLANEQPANPATAGVKALLDKVLALAPGQDRSPKPAFGSAEVRAEAESLLRQFAQ